MLPMPFLLYLQDCVEKGQLSNCQLETVIYAFMRFEKRLANGMLLTLSSTVVELWLELFD